MAYNLSRKTTGFTLIEVMVVLFIMGIVASSVVMNFTGHDNADLLKKQAQRFEVVFNMASDFAVLNQKQLGLRIEEKTNSYYFMLLDENQELSFDVSDFGNSKSNDDAQSEKSASPDLVEEINFETEVLLGRTLDSRLSSVVGLDILV